MDMGVWAPRGSATGCHLGAHREPPEKRWGTHRILDSREVHIRLLQPVVEVLSVVSGVPLAIGGHAEHRQGVLYL